MAIRSGPLPKCQVATRPPGSSRKESGTEKRGSSSDTVEGPPVRDGGQGVECAVRGQFPGEVSAPAGRDRYTAGRDSTCTRSLPRASPSLADPTGDESARSRAGGRGLRPARELPGDRAVATESGDDPPAGVHAGRPAARAELHAASCGPRGG